MTTKKPKRRVGPSLPSYFQALVGDSAFTADLRFLLGFGDIADWASDLVSLAIDAMTGEGQLDHRAETILTHTRIKQDELRRLLSPVAAMIRSPDDKPTPTLLANVARRLKLPDSESANLQVFAKHFQKVPETTLKQLARRGARSNLLGNDILLWRSLKTRIWASVDLDSNPGYILPVSSIELEVGNTDKSKIESISFYADAVDLDRLIAALGTIRQRCIDAERKLSNAKNMQVVRYDAAKNERAT